VEHEFEHQFDADVLLLSLPSGGNAVHQVQDTITTISAALEAAADANPVYLATGDKATVLVELGRLEAQVHELKLRVLGDCCADTTTTSSTTPPTRPPDNPTATADSTGARDLAIAPLDRAVTAAPLGLPP
jgi:hypothetical protein